LSKQIKAIKTIKATRGAGLPRSCPAHILRFPQPQTNEVKILEVLVLTGLAYSRDSLTPTAGEIGSSEDMKTIFE